MNPYNYPFPPYQIPPPHPRSRSLNMPSNPKVTVPLRSFSLNPQACSFTPFTNPTSTFLPPQHTVPPNFPLVPYGVPNLTQQMPTYYPQPHYPIDNRINEHGWAAAATAPIPQQQTQPFHIPDEENNQQAPPIEHRPRTTPVGRGPYRRGPPLPLKKYTIKAEDIVPGCILWLHAPKSGDRPIICVREHDCRDREKEAEGHNHPVLVLRVRQNPGSDLLNDLMIDVAPMTSLKGDTIIEYLNRLKSLEGSDDSVDWHYKSTMPLRWPRGLPKDYDIDEELQSRGNGLLDLVTGCEMQRQTYVRILHAYAVPISQLYAVNRFNKNAFNVRLAKHSFVTVMNRLGLNPDYGEERPASLGGQANNRDRNQVLRDTEIEKIRQENLARHHAAMYDYSQAQVDFVAYGGHRNIS